MHGGKRKGEVRKEEAVRWREERGARAGKLEPGED